MSTLDYIPYKLRDWIHKFLFLDNFWQKLCLNSNAVDLLEQNQDKIDWNWLSLNPNAIYLLEQNQDKIDWEGLSMNPKAIHLLEQNPDKISWGHLSGNPNGKHLLEKNQDKINCMEIASNPFIFEIDYQALQQRIEPFKEELIQKCFHPDRLIRYLNIHQYDIGEDEYQD